MTVFLISLCPRKFLNQPRIGPLFGKEEPASMSQHVGVHLEAEAGLLTGTRNDHLDSVAANSRTALAHRGSGSGA